MKDDFLNDEEFWKELGLDLENLELVGDAPTEPESGAEKTVKQSGEEKPEKSVKKSGKKTSGKKKSKKEQAKPAKPAKPEREEPERIPTVAGTIGATFVKTVAVALCAVLTVALLGGMLLLSGSGSSGGVSGASGVTILDKFDMFLTNQVSSALDGVLSIKKVYWLNDADTVAPKPKAENYGHVSTPAELMWLLDEAAELIGDQEMIFNENTPVWEKKGIHYYHDETILVITWKEVIDRVVYNMSEVRIAHGSQFRRFLAGGEFGSDKLYVTTDMAASVNSVVASSGDFYRFRRAGAVVYEGQLRRFEGNSVDTCFINEDGDLIFAYRGDLTSEAEAEQLIADEKVRFSLAFGPILVDNGVARAPESYPLGEINDIYARAAICQVDKLHYLIVSACGEENYQNRHNIKTFAKNLESFGVDKAYTLDGGQTTVITMDGKMINDVEFGYQRKISDIIYFATAMPEGE